MRWAMALSAILLCSCGRSESQRCDPGDRQACTCPDGTTSVRECLRDGTGWEACECPCRTECAGRECGPDPRCGVSCGDCIDSCTGEADPRLCHEGSCTQACCPATCAELGGECGMWDDGCGELLNCGTCGDNARCTREGMCECRFEACGDTCCEQGQGCHAGRCCAPDCTGRECGDDGCGGRCLPGCAVDEACLDGACVSMHCGNGTVEGSEECDGDDLGGLDCGSQGFDGGTLACGADCRLDASGCCDVVGEDPCAGQTCSDHGTCRLDDACQPFCVCDIYYEPGPGLTCVPEGCRRTGEACASDSQCCNNFCLVHIGQTGGYCSERDCLSDEECVNHAGDGREMCCVDTGGLDLCMRTGVDGACGDQAGGCGASCAAGGYSDCLPATGCYGAAIDDPGAFCTIPCGQDADCAVCVDENDPDVVYTCQSVAGGGAHCLPAVEATCANSTDCSTPDVCVPFLDPEGQSLVGRCHSTDGALPAGSACVDEPGLPPQERCLSGYCLWDHCTEVCGDDPHCPAGMLCSSVTFCLDPPDCAATDSIGMCQWMGGSLAACDGDNDCPAAETCGVHVNTGGSIDKVCVPESCDPADVTCLATGEAGCSEPGFTCRTDLCLSTGVCTSLCAGNPDCPAGTECKWIGVGGGLYTPACLPHGVFSPLCSLCETSADCPGDAECISGDVDPDERFCGLPCPGGDECPAGFSCTDVGGLVDNCVPDGGSCMP